MEDNFNLKEFGKEIQTRVRDFEKKHNFNLKRVKHKGTVLIPKVIGRENPMFIKTDEFDFAKTLETINTVASTVQQVSQTVQQVNAAVSTQNNTVKATVQTPPISGSSLLNAGYKFLENNNPTINNGYNTNTQVTGQPKVILQPEPSLNMQTMMLIGGGVLLMVVVLVLTKRN